MITDHDIVSYFHRHLVPILITLQRGSVDHTFAITAFVLSVQGYWFLITAGHCVKQVDELEEESGYQILRCFLIDSLGSGATFHEPIPFAYRNANPIHLSDDLDFDYGVVPVSSYYRQLLEANNVQPLNEEVWKKQPSHVDFYALLGVPNELTEVEADNVKITSTLHRIEPLDTRPKDAPDTDVPLIYGRIALGKDLTNIEGMSGGPILGFHNDKSGKMRYWLIALQSRWNPSSRLVIGCPMNLLGRYLEAEILKFQE
jgi:hypothetical protein